MEDGPWDGEEGGGGGGFREEYWARPTVFRLLIHTVFTDPDYFLDKCIRVKKNTFVE